MWTNIENIVLYAVSMGAPTLVLIIIGVQYLKSRHEERIRIIEKGGELPKITLGDFFSPLLVLKSGLFLIGVSLGVFAGFFLSRGTGFNISDETAYFITIPLFTGITLILSYFIKK
jgi:hypothetical protein